MTVYRIKCHGEYLCAIGSDTLDGFIRCYWTDDDGYENATPLTFKTAKDARAFRAALFDPAWYLNGGGKCLMPVVKLNA